MTITLDKRYEQEIEAEKRISALLMEGKITSLENACDILWYKYELFTVHSIAVNDFEAVRRMCFVGGLLDIFRVENFNSRILDYSITHVLNALLSDCNEMIGDYAKIRYEKGQNSELSMSQMVLNGESAIWCNTIQLFMQKDLEGVERNLNIIESKTLPKLPKKQQELKIDFEFYKALLMTDKLRCEELLKELISPKVHKKRNDNAILNEYVSQPALGYAKLAWRLGIEVEVNSPLIPKELLPIEPLKNYEIPYDFLKSEN
jgi:hypothetical protein